jgi:inner membrane protein
MMDANKKDSVRKFTAGYTFKVLMLMALVLLLLIPLGMIRGLVRERSRTVDEAEADIMEAWGAELAQGGPVLRIPGIRTTTHRTQTEKDGEKIELMETPFALIVAPEELTIEADFKTEVRRRGIFSVPLFYGDLRLSGVFDPARAIAALLPNERLDLQGAELVISLSSQKGIRRINEAGWNGEALFFQPGDRGVALAGSGRGGAGIYSSLPGFENKPARFDISIAIQGGKFVRVLPVGQDTHVRIASDWGSPSFQGAFLPLSSSITDTSFEAEWDVSYLSRNIPLFWTDERGEISDALFGVDFYRQIDTYSLNTRAVKYAIIFLIIPFLTLFLLEIFVKTRIHLVPYILSGMGNVIFYLLLLSLSEQMAFFPAYLIAALSVTVMLTLYSHTLVPSWNKSFYMGFAVTVSYVLLYAVLNAESYALLIGSIGVFVIVALVMFLTRFLYQPAGAAPQGCD